MLPLLRAGEQQACQHAQRLSHARPCLGNRVQALGYQVSIGRWAGGGQRVVQAPCPRLWPEWGQQQQRVLPCSACHRGAGALGIGSRYSLVRASR